MELLFLVPIGLLSLILCTHGISAGGDGNIANPDYGTPTSTVQPGYKVDNKLVFTSILFEPYLMESDNPNAQGNDRYEGFIADLVKELARRLDFEYTIKLVEDGKWGSRDTSSGKWNGMIGEVISNRADLAAAPITMTTLRANVVDFTTAFQDVSTTTLVLADSGFSTLEQIINNKNMSFGCLAMGSTAELFKGDMKMAKLWSQMESKNSFASSTKDGKDRVLRGGYAFFMEKPMAEYMVSQDCRLTTVGEMFESQGYAFPVKRGNADSRKLKDKIDIALAEMKQDGTMVLIKETWWSEECAASTAGVAASLALVLSALTLALGA